MSILLARVIAFWVGTYLAICSWILDDNLTSVIERGECTRALAIVMGPHWAGGIESSVGVPALLSGAWANQNPPVKIWPAIPAPHEPDEACLYHG